jgi:hypothetical protein
MPKLRPPVPAAGEAPMTSFEVPRPALGGGMPPTLVRVVIHRDQATYKALVSDAQQDNVPVEQPFENGRFIPKTGRSTKVSDWQADGGSVPRAVVRSTTGRRLDCPDARG